MRILAASSFRADADSGAAGTLLSIAEVWEQLGHSVKLLWMGQPSRSRAIDELWRTPRLQRQLLAAELAEAAEYDVVVLSQPFAFLAFEKLAAEYPRTIFVNRTHGWEAREIECRNRFGWEPASSLVHAALRKASEVWKRTICRRTAWASHGIVTACNHDATWIRDRYQLPEWRVRSIPYGIDAEGLPRRTVAAERRQPLRLIYAGQYFRRKGSQTLEQVLPVTARMFPEARLTFCVQDEAVAELERIYRPDWKERLQVFGWMHRAELYGHYANHDILLFPSLFEGFGKVLLEAMGLGCVPVAYEKTTFLDESSWGGPLCPPADSAAFGDALHRLMRHPEDLTNHSMGAVEFARSRSWQTTAQEHVDYFTELRARLVGRNVAPPELPVST